MRPTGRRPSSFLVALTLVSLGCGSFSPSLAYRSSHEVDRGRTRVDVRVEMLPGMPIPDDDYSNQLTPGDEARLAGTLREAVAVDLDQNGPFAFDPKKPDAILELRVAVMAMGKANSWWKYPPWFVWYLFAIPIYSRVFSLSIQARLLHPSGALIAEATASEECTRWSGVYYGYSVAPSCAAEGAIEKLRDHLSSQREKIAALIDKLNQERIAGPIDRPTPAAVPAARPIAFAPSVVAVFDLEDPSKRLGERLAEELTVYLATKMTERGFRVVPRDQLRARLVETKAESYQACYDASCQIELGKAVAAEKSLATRLLLVGKTCAMTSTMFDLKSETTERAASVKTDCSEDALLAGIDRMVDQLRGVE